MLKFFHLHIGVVDQQEVLKNNQMVAMEYQKKLQETANQTKKDFDTKAEGLSDEEKEKLYADMSQEFNEKRVAIEKDMKDRIEGVVKSVASKKGLSLVVEKSAVIYGGTDITKEVSDAMAQQANKSAGTDSEKK